MDRRWRQIASYAIDMLGGLFYLTGFICVMGVIKFFDTILSFAHELFPKLSLPSRFGGLALLLICGAVCAIIGAWIRSVADRMAPPRESEKSLLGLERPSL